MSEVSAFSAVHHGLNPASRPAPGPPFLRAAIVPAPPLPRSHVPAAKCRRTPRAVFGISRAALSRRTGGPAQLGRLRPRVGLALRGRRLPAPGAAPGRPAAGHHPRRSAACPVAQLPGAGDVNAGDSARSVHSEGVTRHPQDTEGATSHREGDARVCQFKWLPLASSLGVPDHEAVAAEPDETARGAIAITAGRWRGRPRWKSR